MDPQRTHIGKCPQRQRAQAQRPRKARARGQHERGGVGRTQVSGHPRAASLNACALDLSHAVDLGRNTKANYGGAYCIGAAGYPEGHAPHLGPCYRRPVPEAEGRLCDHAALLRRTSVCGLCRHHDVNHPAAIDAGSPCIGERASDLLIQPHEELCSVHGRVGRIAERRSMGNSESPACGDQRVPHCVHTSRLFQDRGLPHAQGVLSSADPLHRHEDLLLPDRLER